MGVPVGLTVTVHAALFAVPEYQQFAKLLARTIAWVSWTVVEVYTRARVSGARWLQPCGA